MVLTEKKTGVFLESEPTWRATTNGHEEDFFYFGKGMDSKHAKSEKNLAGHIGKTWGQDVLSSMKENKIVILTMEAPTNISKAQFEALSWTDQKDWSANHRAYSKCRVEMRTNLSKVYSLLLAHCHASMLCKLKGDKDFIKLEVQMKKSIPHNLVPAGQLWYILSKICNGTDVGEFPIAIFLESLYNLLAIHGDNYNSSADYLDSFEQRAKVGEKSGVLFITEELRDLCLSEYVARGDVMNVTYKALQEWEDAEKHAPYTDTAKEEARQGIITTGQLALHDKVMGNIYLKRSGPEFNSYRTELNNRYPQGREESGSCVSEQHMRMETWSPAYTSTQEYIEQPPQKEKTQKHVKNNTGVKPPPEEGIPGKQRQDEAQLYPGFYTDSKEWQNLNEIKNPKERYAKLEEMFEDMDDTYQHAEKCDDKQSTGVTRDNDDYKPAPEDRDDEIVGGCEEDRLPLSEAYYEQDGEAYWVRQKRDRWMDDDLLVMGFK